MNTRQQSLACAALYGVVTVFLGTICVVVAVTVGYSAGGVYAAVFTGVGAAISLCKSVVHLEGAIKA